MQAIELNRVCRDCEQIKPITEYNKDPKSRGGFRAECKQCRGTRRGNPARTLTGLVPSEFHKAPVVIPYFQTIAESDLPDVERLPAAYLKRAHTYWAELVGSDDEPVRRLL